MKKNAGQAVFELTIALLAICFVVIGILFVGGVGITSIKSLLNAKTAAEVNASTAAAGRVTGTDIGGWRYTTVVYKADDPGGSVEIPFLANDAPYAASGGIDRVNTLETAAESRSIQPYAAGQETMQYVFLPHSGLTDVSSPSQLLSNSSFSLANLVFSPGVLPTQLQRYGGEEIYTIHRLNNPDELKERIYRAGWFDLRNIDVSGWESNVVALPALAPVTPGVSD